MENVFTDVLQENTKSLHVDDALAYISKEHNGGKYFCSLASLFVISTKCSDPWVLEFVVSSTKVKSMRNLYFVGF
jgi:hypothetical protein